MFVKKKETKQQVIEVKKIVEKTGPTYHTNSVALEWMEEDSSRPFAHTHHENERRTDAAKAISATALFSLFFVFHFGDTSTKTFCDERRIDKKASCLLTMMMEWCVHSFSLVPPSSDISILQY